jgi:hypothetical protein
VPCFTVKICQTGTNAPARTSNNYMHNINSRFLLE